MTDLQKQKAFQTKPEGQRGLEEPLTLSRKSPFGIRLSPGYLDPSGM
jgi:hypothetical protein